MAESIALYSSSSTSPISHLQPAIASRSTALSFLSLRRTSVPKFRGLKVRSSTSNAQNAPRPTEKPSIISQVQDTASLDIPTVTDSTWKSLVLNADGPVLVEFWAPWCGPCRMIHPVVGELAKEYAGKLTCFRLSTDDSPSIATQYGIRSVPTMMIFSKGEKKDTVLGAVPKTTLTASIVKYL